MVTTPTVFPQVVLSDQSGNPYDVTAPLPVSGSFSSSAKATAAAPTYIEGSTDPLSMDLTGALRITGTINASSTATATAAAPTYTEGTSDPFSQNLSGDLRTIAKQSGTWTVTGAGGTFPVTGTFFQATQPVVGAGASGATKAGNPVQIGAVFNTTQPTVTTGQTVEAQATARGGRIVATGVDTFNVTVNAALPAGTAVIGHVITDSGSTTAVTGTVAANVSQINAVTPLMGNGVTGTGSQRVTIASDNTAFSVNAIQSGTWNVGTVTAVTAITNALPAGTNVLGHNIPDATATTGGIASTNRLLSAAATTNATSAKGSAGRLYSIQGYNVASSVRYLKIYNKATAPTVGTDTPIKTLALPPGVGFAFDWPLGYSFATGIAYALTTGSADADTGALTAGDVLGLNLDYV